MKMKRGTDHHWHVIRYKGNMAYYAKCKCGYEYCCGSAFPKEIGINKIYPYCPVCGARKKWYNEIPELIIGPEWD
jgi:hypothetical protein